MNTTSPCVFPDSHSVLRRWLEAFNGKQLEGLLSLYSPQCLLMPTFSPHALRTDASRRSYFTQLCARPGMCASFHERTILLQEVSPGVEIASGIYRFQFDIDEEPLVFEARFSFLVDRSQSAPILHHHSSQIPRTVS